jgi:hypothetical protein
MKTTFKKRIVLGLALAIASAVSAGPALAAGGHGGGGHGGGGSHGGHGGWHGGTRYVVGLNFGFGGYYGYPYSYYPYYPYYSYPYYPAYYPSPVVQQQPTTYVEQAQPQAQEQPSGYWYYCPVSKGYYPYVRECSAGWQRVAPQPGN